MKKGKGIFAQMKSAEIKSEFTVDDFNEMLSLLSKKPDSEELGAAVGGSFMLNCPDRMFQFYWAFKNLTVLTDTETYNKILDRAKSLGIVHEHKYIKQDEHNTK